MSVTAQFLFFSKRHNTCAPFGRQKKLSLTAGYPLRRSYSPGLRPPVLKALL